MARYMDTIKQILAVCLFAIFLPVAAMADADEFEADDYLNFSKEARAGDSDPLEGLNRAVHEFNYVVDTVVFDPLASVYNGVLPEFARAGIHNFLQNIEAPVVFANSLLQGDPQNVFVTFWRFVFNTTLGVGGLFDVATALGVPDRSEEDFGQTLAVWGVGHGAYLVLPIIGPSSLRDLPGRIVDVFLNPLVYNVANWPEDYALVTTDAIDTRARLDKFIDQVNGTSLDPYATFRSLYLQRRNAEVNNFADADKIR